MATALETVALAAVKAGLAEIEDVESEDSVPISDGAKTRYVRIPFQVRAFGMQAINRVALWIWHQYPYREQRIIDLAVPVDALAATVSLPTELDAVRSVVAYDRAVYPIHETTEMRQGETWRRMAAGEPLRSVSLPDGLDGEGNVVRRIKLVPPAAKDVTLYVNGLRRFSPLEAGDTFLLTRTSNALFDYLVAEMFEFDDQQDRADKERQKAGQELTAALEWQETVEETDTAATPCESFMD